MNMAILAAISADNTGIPKVELGPDSVIGALQLVFGLAGGLALVIITLAGLQFVMARGDPQAVAKARNTIFFALVGLVISMFAFSMVSFVIGRV